MWIARRALAVLVDASVFQVEKLVKERAVMQY
jgi:hypothetical protein